ncbi:MAG: hypothetical protein FADNKDHG_01503 [Holosporales bacterium]
MTSMKEIQEKIKAYFDIKDNPDLLKKRQNILFFSFLGGCFVLIGSIFLIKTKQSKTTPTEEKEQVRKVDTSKESVDQRKVWVERLETEMEVIKKKNDELEKLVTTLTQKSLAADHLQMMNHNTLSGEKIHDQTPHTLNSLSVDQEKPVVQAATKKSHKITRIEFKLEENAAKKGYKSIDHYVPAGTFVKARLTSGVVASTSVGAASEPQPIHMEMTDFGTLPRAFKTDLKKCFLIGSAYGDLASERVFMRLETLSCIERKTQEVIEIKVDGYVSGEDGANGMRGLIIDKSGPAMRNAFMGGFISGVGGFLSDKNGGSTQISPMGVTSQQALSAGELLKGGAGKGIGNAMEKLSDFYIKRAEQLQPVIEIEPGREIDVVFKAGFDMNQTLFRQTLKNHQDRYRQSDVSNTFE